MHQVLISVRWLRSLLSFFQFALVQWNETSIFPYRRPRFKLLSEAQLTLNATAAATTVSHRPWVVRELIIPIFDDSVDKSSYLAPSVFFLFWPLWSLLETFYVGTHRGYLETRNEAKNLMRKKKTTGSLCCSQTREPRSLNKKKCEIIKRPRWSLLSWFRTDSDFTLDGGQQQNAARWRRRRWGMEADCMSFASCTCVWVECTIRSRAANYFPCRK